MLGGGAKLETKMDSIARELASRALAITAQDWTCLGFSEDPQVAPSNNLKKITERIVALLAIRSVAVLSNLEDSKDFSDFSTTTICRKILLKGESCWPKSLTKQVIDELRAYCLRILGLYNDKPYHNKAHAYHVLLSANKLLDLLLNCNFHTNNGHERYPTTFGLRRNTMSQFALLFAALIHDCHHGGISNRQLALEDDPISIVYNDASILEQQSLTIAFVEFLQPEFSKIRKALFPSREVYSAFRKECVNLVLATDIANPERMQLTKDKWKTAFGDVDQSNAKRKSTITVITMPKQCGHKESRRRSVGSLFSELSFDEDASKDGDSVSDSSDQHEAFGASAQSGSFDGAVESAGKISKGSRGRCKTPDSEGGLSFIDEVSGSGTLKSSSGRISDVRIGNTKNNMRDLGYSPQPSKQNNYNGDRSPMPDKSTTSEPIRKSSELPMTNRRVSATDVPNVARGNPFRRRRASIASYGTPMERMQRRLSTSADIPQKFRQRVGIMRAVDLSGEMIENFSRKPSLRTTSEAENSHGNQRHLGLSQIEEYDEPDDLRAAVVMETILLASDVAHNLQGWDHMLKWSQNLFWELYDANEAGRGFDPSPGWFSGQTGFLQGYMLPLAQKLGHTGVFGNQIGPLFAEIVEDITEQWEIHGEEVTALLLSRRDLDILAIRSRDRLITADDQGSQQEKDKR